MRAVLLVLLLLLFSQTAHAQTKPFGLDELPIQTGNVRLNWDAVREASRQDGQSRELLVFKKQFEGLSGRSLVGHVNRAVNQLLRPASDLAQWGVPDHWSPALETLSQKAGDCEDYAILKYAVLKLFLPTSSLKLVIGHDPILESDHMLLLAWIEGKWLALNNSTNTLVKDVRVSPQRFKPMFSLTEEGAFQLQPSVKQATLQ